MSWRARHKFRSWASRGEQNCAFGASRPECRAPDKDMISRQRRREGAVPVPRAKAPRLFGRERGEEPAVVMGVVCLRLGEVFCDF